MKFVFYLFGSANETIPITSGSFDFMHGVIPLVSGYLFVTLLISFSQLFRHPVKVARYNSFVATPSIFEFLTLKQIDLYGKHITHVRILNID